MITRVEYQSWDYGRSATILWVAEKHWHVMLRAHVGNSTQSQPWPVIQVRERRAKSLTSAQSMARTWCR